MTQVSLDPTCQVTTESKVLPEILIGECGDCKAFETPKPKDGKYDPNWISCFRSDNPVTKEMSCYCFHPNQGKDNGDFGRAWQTDKEILQPGTPLYEDVKELPKTGQDLCSFGSPLIWMILGYLVFGLVMYLASKKRNK